MQPRLGKHGNTFLFRDMVMVSRMDVACAQTSTHASSHLWSIFVSSLTTAVFNKIYQ